MHIHAQKRQLRDAVRERVLTMSVKDRRVEQNSLCKQIIKAINVDPQAVFAAYMPLSDEADIRPVLTHILETGATLYLPCFEQRGLVFRKADSIHNLRTGAFSIFEPLPSAPILDPAILNIALIPGRAFDAKGNRIGRGYSAYDRWMADQRTKNPATKFYGVCLECQMFPSVPTEEHDQRMDGVITVRGLKKASL